jgi:uncharacterized protein (DUF433 family)
MTVPGKDVRSDEHGVWRVGTSGISLDSVVYAFLKGGAPEDIQDQYPALSLEEVDAAIAFYLGNRPEVLLYLEQREELWEEARRRVEENPSPVVERLRALRAAENRE